MSIALLSPKEALSSGGAEVVIVLTGNELVLHLLYNGDQSQAVPMVCVFGTVKAQAKWVRDGVLTCVGTCVSPPLVGGRQESRCALASHALPPLPLCSTKAHRRDCTDVCNDR